MTTTTITRKIAKTLATARTTETPVYFRRESIPSLEGLAAGDVVAVWQDGNRAPWIATVDGVSIAQGDDVVSIAGFTGVNGGGRSAVRNINSGALYMIAGGPGGGMPRDLGLIAKIEKISL